jgi:arsenate reductase (glutaredoxin)
MAYPFNALECPAMKAVIYHNTKCSKSNAALDFLLAHTSDVEVINYLETPLCADALRHLLSFLKIEARSLVRFGEPIARELQISIDDKRHDNEWLSLMTRYPVLIERPIVMINDKAIIARPPERVLDLVRAQAQQDSDI